MAPTKVNSRACVIDRKVLSFANFLTCYPLGLRDHLNPQIMIGIDLFEHLTKTYEISRDVGTILPEDKAS